jgi:multisubunit Na+/H+ antiporter MnhG subunit
MFSSQAAELIANRAFVLKMGLLTLAGANAGLFHARDGLNKLDAIARAQTALSLGLWLGVIICGRWIAYR